MNNLLNDRSEIKIYIGGKIKKIEEMRDSAIRKYPDKGLGEFSEKLIKGFRLLKEVV